MARPTIICLVALTVALIGCHSEYEMPDQTITDHIEEGVVEDDDRPIISTFDEIVKQLPTLNLPFITSCSNPCPTRDLRFSDEMEALYTIDGHPLTGILYKDDYSIAIVGTMQGPIPVTVLRTFTPEGELIDEEAFRGSLCDDSENADHYHYVRFESERFVVRNMWSEYYEMTYDMNELTLEQIEDGDLPPYERVSAEPISADSTITKYTIDGKGIITNHSAHFQQTRIVR